MKGKITNLTDRNFGFIEQEDGGDLFFHANNLVDVRFEELEKGDEVEFEVTDTPRGQAADKVRKV